MQTPSSCGSMRGCGAPFPGSTGSSAATLPASFTPSTAPLPTDLAVGDRVMGCIDEGGGAAEYVNAAGLASSLCSSRVRSGLLSRVSAGPPPRRSCAVPVQPTLLTIRLTKVADVKGTFDVVVDTANYGTPISVMRDKLNEGGRCITLLGETRT